MKILNIEKKQNNYAFTSGALSKSAKVETELTRVSLPGGYTLGTIVKKPLSWRGRLESFFRKDIMDITLNEERRSIQVHMHKNEARQRREELRDFFTGWF